MVTANDTHTGLGDSERPKYLVDIEGTEHPWAQSTITVQEIRTLGGLPSDVPVMEIDTQNNQQQLPEDENIELKPGHGYSKKIKYGRGQ
jgi:hypothetical protein